MPDYTQYAPDFWKQQPQATAGGNLAAYNALGGDAAARMNSQLPGMAYAGGSPNFNMQPGGNGSMLALMQQLGMGMGGIPQFQPQFNFQQPQYQRMGLGQQMAGGGAMPAFLQQLMQQYGNRGGLLGGGQRPPGASVGLGMPAPQGNPYRTSGGVADPTTNTQIGNFQQPAGGMYSAQQGGAWQGTDAQLQQFLGPQSAAQQAYQQGGNNYLDEYNARRAARGLPTQGY